MPKIFRDLEKKLEGIFEDLFGRAFRSGVQPIEIARKLIHEMDDNKRIGVSAVYVPNRYTVFLGKDDRQKITAFEEPILSEIEDYLSKHARESDYRFVSSPKVSIELDEELKLGEFGILTEFEEPGETDRASQSMQMRTAIYRPGMEDPDLKFHQPASTELKAILFSKSIPGGKFQLAKESTTIGRSKKNDLAIVDSRVSRKHVEIVRDESGRFIIVDLGSTNGSFLNGQKIKKSVLNDGDVIAIGVTEIRFKKEA